ncbi:MAG: M28 family peptidase [Sediminispirochaetaceae bacterium]
MKKENNDKSALQKTIDQDLRELAEHIGARPTGSAPNRKAAGYIKKRFCEHGWEIETQEFEAIDWKRGSCTLFAGGEAIAVQVNPYSPPCSIEAQAALFRTLDELAAAPSLENTIAVLDGEFIVEQIMPKNFVFYNPEEHLRLNHLLEEKAPAAVIAVAQNTHGGDRAEEPQNSASPGPQEPSATSGSSATPGPPLFADGDMRIPSVTISAAEGKKLRRSIGQLIKLTIDSKTETSTARNVIARLHPGAPKKIVVVAHFDTWFDTPGAMDNAVGAAVLLSLPSLLDKIDPGIEIELFANNGEDYYSSAGSLLYIERSLDIARTVLAVNIDGIGYRGRETGLSLYDCPASLSDSIRGAQQSFSHIVDMEPWPEGDHSIFVMQGVPAIALTTLNIHDLMNTYHHTHKDRVENIDTKRVAEATEFIAEVLCT